MSPLAKVGGLGDVAGSLPRALVKRGLDVRVAMPLYANISRESLEPVARDIEVPWPGGPQRASLWRTDVRGVTVYLVEHGGSFGRANVYGFDDDADRFLLFCDALLAAAPRLGFAPDVIHAQDWHTGPLFARLAASPAHPWARCGRVYTIHNLALKGPFDGAWAERHGIGQAQLAVPDRVDAGTAYSCMGQGILHADRVNTVSETYAKEVLTPEYGAGLELLLQARSNTLSGIVNGIDYVEFNPETDPALAQHYSIETLERRIENKRALQREAGLPQDDGAMLFGVVTRLWTQKGIDLVPPAFEKLLARNAQLAVLGTGDQQVHDMLQQLEARHPRQMKVWLDFNPPLGQRIYGGCDCFLMPSRYEPCGLGQLISLRYGAVPLVRRTGGLADTVQDADPALRTGNGFVFEAATAHELEHACERALAAFGNPRGWRALQERGMRQDWSWGHAAGAYADLYELTRSARS